MTIDDAFCLFPAVCVSEPWLVDVFYPFLLSCSLYSHCRLWWPLRLLILSTHLELQHLVQFCHSYPNWFCGVVITVQPISKLTNRQWKSPLPLMALKISLKRQLCFPSQELFARCQNGMLLATKKVTAGRRWSDKRRTSQTSSQTASWRCLETRLYQRLSLGFQMAAPSPSLDRAISLKESCHYTFLKSIVEAPTIYHRSIKYSDNGKSTHSIVPQATISFLGRY